MKKLLVLMFLAGALITGLYVAYILTRPEKVIGFDEKIHHDDFDYSVLKVEKLKNMGDGAHSPSTQGTFYVVTLKVENNAKRVMHVWNDSMAYIVDDAGKEYHPSPEGQKAWDLANGKVSASFHSTPAGVSETTQIVFDLPDDAKNPCLKIWKDVLMGDMFDGIAYRKVKVSL